MTTNSASGIGSSSLTTLGTIVTGVWNGTPVTVPYGGTGDSSFTAYSVLCGGTTSTGILQNVSGLGSSGQVLTSNGASALPTWQNSNAGSFQLIDSITASNQAAVIFNSQFSSTYDVYLFTFTNLIPVTNATILYSQVGTGSTPTWTTTGYYWSSLGQDTSYFVDHGENDTQIKISCSNATTHYVPNSKGGISGYLYVYGTNNSSNMVTGTGRFVYVDTASNIMFISNINFYNVAATYTSIQFYFNSGNVNSGIIRMYGIT